MISPESGAAVSLTVPMRAEYVSIARLTAAGVANRVGFDIEAIEDIKVSLSEVCNRIINSLNERSLNDCADCKIEFVVSKTGLGLNFYLENMDLPRLFMRESPPPENGAPGVCFNGRADIKTNLDALIDGCRMEGQKDKDHLNEEQIGDQLQLSLISILMDEFEVNPKKGCLVSMKKLIEC
jgi:anti-sigma regulatory factor (Ser/Thr protein kinase)